MKKEMVKLTNNIILRSLQKNAMIAAKNEILKINDQSSVYGLTLTPDDVEEVINELQDVFYYLKNETLDKISDDEIIDLIGEFYEKSSGRIDNIENLAEKFAMDFKCKRVNIDE